VGVTLAVIIVLGRREINYQVRGGLLRCMEWEQSRAYGLYKDLQLSSLRNCIECVAWQLFLEILVPHSREPVKKQENCRVY